MSDVCIVGAGPAGLTAALALGSAGRSVLLLESGGFCSANEAQELNDGDQEGVPYQGLACTRHRQVGGTANIWNVSVQDRPGAKYVPLDARDIASWPIGWNDLEPHYLDAQKLCGLGPFEYGADYWASATCRPFETSGTGLTSGVYQFGFADRFTGHILDRLRLSEAMTLALSWTVVGLIVDHAARCVCGVRAIGMDGRVREVKARTVILACGAVENARLLLLAGLGGDANLQWLGRGFMEHARDFSLVLVPDSRELFAAASFYDLHTSRQGVLIGGRLTLTDEASHCLQLPNASMTLVPQSRARPGSGLLHQVFRRIRRARNARRGRYGWSQARYPTSAFDFFSIILNLEQRPHPWNRIELGSRRDRFGNPLPRLILQWTDEEQAVLDRLRDLLREWFRSARLGSLLVTRGHRPDMNAHHHAGTTRMALQPKDGVVDPHGRVFGLENLYMAGASVFPTAGFANPTLTIVALALRLARHVDDSLG